MTDAGFTDYTWAGENIACGYPDALRTFIQWVESPSHLANLMSPHYRYMGIAREGNSQQRCSYYWTNDFGSYSDPNDDAPVSYDPKLLEAAINAAIGYTKKTN